MIWNIAVKQKEKYNILSGINTRGKNGQPTLSLWDEASPGLITDPKDNQ